MRLFTLTKACTIAAILATTAGAAHADLVYSFADTSTFNGTPATNLSTVYATATFSQVTNNIVKLVMETLSTIPAGYYVNDWAFNFINGTSISKIEHSTNDVIASSYTLDPNHFKLNGGGDPLFDFGFSFSNASPGQLAATKTSTYQISSINPLSFNDFYSVSFNQNGSTTPAYFAGIHVQGGGTSYAVAGEGRGGSQGTVPEPGSVALIGLGILGVALVRRRTRRIDG